MTTTIKCAHHWIIEEANGPTSAGKCQRCHEVREFQNSFGDGGDWHNQNRKMLDWEKAHRQDGVESFQLWDGIG